MKRTRALVLTVVLALTLAGSPLLASTVTTAVVAPSGNPTAVEVGPSQQQQSAWLGSLLLSFLSMIGAVCLVSAWAAWAYHRAVAASIRCGVVVRRPVRIPAPVRVTIPARTVARPALRPAVALPPAADLSLDELFSLAADRRPVSRTLGARVLAWGRSCEAPLVAAARLGGRVAEVVRRGVPGDRRVLRWNGLAFVGVPEEAHRARRAGAGAESLRLVS